MPTVAQPSDVAVLLRTEHAVARVLASMVTEDDAYPQLLEAIGTALAWDFAAMWEPIGSRGSFLRCVATWQAVSMADDALVKASRATRLPRGQGLPGEVWKTGRSAWIADAKMHPRRLPRAEAATKAGLLSAFAVPIRGTGGVLAVMEFFAAAERAPDDELLATMTSLGSQIGQFVERCRATHALAESDARKSAILNAAFDCIITMDGDGLIVEVNDATVATFGYSAEEMIGQELAEIMIPPGIRDEHRRGLRRYMDTGASRIVGHPVELSAMRKDGSVFPIELAVTRPDLPGAPLFCGYLRDVTERRDNERSLQRLADEQTALRRVATAVAAEIAPERLFGLVAEEVGRALNARIANIVRFSADATGVVVGAWSNDTTEVPVGTVIPLEGETTSARIWRTGRPARVDTLDRVTGDLAKMLRERGVRAAVGAPIMLAGRLWGAVIISTARPEPFPPGAEQHVANFADLAAQALANAQTREQLAASRARIVEAGDAERRRLERNLHDGAQQRLIATSLNVRLAARRAEDPELRALLDGAGDELALALEELRELARGLHPAILSDHGLLAAVEALAQRAPLPVDVDVELDGRLPEPVEAAAYYVVAEALTNVAKYAQATQARVRVHCALGMALVEVADNGVGGARESGGSGLRGLVDRVEALGGRLSLASPVGRGTTVRAELPAPATS
jgi:PAS domain S-box-containing protein